MPVTPLYAAWFKALRLQAAAGAVQIETHSRGRIPLGAAEVVATGQDDDALYALIGRALKPQMKEE